MGGLGLCWRLWLINRRILDEFNLKTSAMDVMFVVTSTTVAHVYCFRNIIVHHPEVQRKLQKNMDKIEGVSKWYLWMTALTCHIPTQQCWSCYASRPYLLWVCLTELPGIPLWGASTSLLGWRSLQTCLLSIMMQASGILPLSFTQSTSWNKNVS